MHSCLLIELQVLAVKTFRLLLPLSGSTHCYFWTSPTVSKRTPLELLFESCLLSFFLFFFSSAVIQTRTDAKTLHYIIFCPSQTTTENTFLTNKKNKQILNTLPSCIHECIRDWSIKCTHTKSHHTVGPSSAGVHAGTQTERCLCTKRSSSVSFVSTDGSCLRERMGKWKLLAMM